MRIPSFVWPTKVHATSTVLIRLGRTVHWTSVLIAAVTFAIGITVGVDNNYRGHLNAEREMIEYISHNREYRSDLMQRLRQADASGDAGYAQQIGLEINRLNKSAPPKASMILLDDSFWYAALGGIFFSLLMFMAGRSARYILSGE